MALHKFYCLSHLVRLTFDRCFDGNILPICLVLMYVYVFNNMRILYFQSRMVFFLDGSFKRFCNIMSHRMVAPGGHFVAAATPIYDISTEIQQSLHFHLHLETPRASLALLLTKYFVEISCSWTAKI